MVRLKRNVVIGALASAFFAGGTPGEAVAQTRYDGLEIVARTRLANNWQLLASYVLSKTEGSVNNQQGESAATGADTGQAGVFASPNRAINRFGRGELDFTHQVRLEGGYHLPIWGGFRVSAVYFYVSGGPWGRTALITGLRQGNETIRVEPRGTRRTQALKQVDLRIEKTFPLGDARRTAGVYVDILNMNNLGMPIVRFRNPLFEQSGRNFGLPRSWIDPRTVQAGIRFTF